MMPLGVQLQQKKKERKRVTEKKKEKERETVKQKEKETDRQTDRENRQRRRKEESHQITVMIWTTISTQTEKGKVSHTLAKYKHTAQVGNTFTKRLHNLSNSNSRGKRAGD